VLRQTGDLLRREIQSTLAVGSLSDVFQRHRCSCALPAQRQNAEFDRNDKDVQWRPKTFRVIWCRRSSGSALPS